MTSYHSSFPLIQLIGSQHISFHNVGAENILQGHRLLFSEKGVCEIRGISTSILLDVRYNHLTQPTAVPRSFHQYLFDTVHVPFHRPFHRRPRKKRGKSTRNSTSLSKNVSKSATIPPFLSFIVFTPTSLPAGMTMMSISPIYILPPFFPPSFTHCFAFPPLPTHSLRAHARRNRTAVSPRYPRGNVIISPASFRRYSAVARVTVPRDFHRYR